MEKDKPKMQWPKIPGSTALRERIVQYKTDTISLEMDDLRKSITEGLEGPSIRVSWNTTTARILGSNCGVRDFGHASIWGTDATSALKREIFALIGWLPMCKNPRNYPYVKVTSLRQETFNSLAANKEEEQDLKEWGWQWRRLKAAAHPFRENYYIYYMFFRMPQPDVYRLRGITADQSKRGQQIVELRKWIDAITAGSKINWINI